LEKKEAPKKESELNSRRDRDGDEDEDLQPQITLTK